MTLRRGEEPVDAVDVAEIAAELRRLEALTAEDGIRTDCLLGDGSTGSLDEEVRAGVLARFVGSADENPRVALRCANAYLAGYSAREEILTRTSVPPWLRYVVKLLLLPVLLGVLVSPIVNFLTARQELQLFQEQRAFDGKQKQAEVLLGSLGRLGVTARELKSSVGYFEASGLTEGQAARLYGKAVELEQEYRLAVQLHHFESLPAIREAELYAYSELRALHDCLLSESGRAPVEGWREAVAESLKDPDLIEKLRMSSTAEPPCGENFDANAFYSFTGAVDSEISRRIGGSLFPASGAKR